ncbi:MAG: chalcone isomerase family protein [Bdellovibrionales bacterium]
MRFLFIFLFILSFSSFSLAGKLRGVELPDTIELDGKKLLLNGMGIRKATILRIKAYVAGLYIEKKSSDRAAISAMKGPKRIELTMLMTLEKDQLTKAWNDSVLKHCPSDCSSLQKALGTLNSYMRAVKRKQKLIIDVIDNKTIVTIRGTQKNPIESADLTAAILKVFIGPKEVDEGMAEGLLGKE